MPEKYDTIVLSGGGIKGLILLGALQCAMDNFLLSNIENYIGTSIGSIICYLLIIGYTPIEIMVYICTQRFFEKIQSFNLVNILSSEGVISYTSIQESLEKMTIEKVGKYLTLKEMKEKYNKNLICVTYNKTLKKAEYISTDNYPDLPCLIALRMSANVPLLFDKFKYMGNFYADGAIINNFAIKHGDEIGKKILGIRIIKDEEMLGNNNSILQDIFHYMYISINQSTEYQISMCSNKCNIISLKDMDSFAFDFNLKSKEKLELFSEGYNQLKSILDLKN